MRSAWRGHALAGRKQRELALGLEAFEVVQAADAEVDGLEVGEQAAEPAVVDVGHAGGQGDVADDVAGLLLGADEQHGPAAVGEGAGELAGLLEQDGGLEQVDDVDAAALAMDEAAHLGVPAARLVAEMDAGLQQFRDAYLSHGLLPYEYALVVGAWYPSGGARTHRSVTGAGRSSWSRAAIRDPSGSRCPI